MLLSGVALAIWNDVAEDRAAEFDDWHVNEHMPERLGLDGFLRGRRYKAASTRRYFTLYEVRDKAVLTSPEYLDRLNHPTEWSNRVVPHVTSRTRTALDVLLSSGHGIGGALATIEVAPRNQMGDQLARWIQDAALAAALARPAIVAAHFGTADTTRSRLNSAEEALMPQADHVARWVLLVEATDEPHAHEAALGITSTIECHGALPDHTTETFVLTNVLEAPR